jgi:hypothetical protein
MVSLTFISSLAEHSTYAHFQERASCSASIRVIFVRSETISVEFVAGRVVSGEAMVGLACLRDLALCVQVGFGPTEDNGEDLRVVGMGFKGCITF